MVNAISFQSFSEIRTQKNPMLMRYDLIALFYNKFSLCRIQNLEALKVLQKRDTEIGSRGQSRSICIGKVGKNIQNLDEICPLLDQFEFKFL